MKKNFIHLLLEYYFCSKRIQLIKMKRNDNLKHNKFHLNKIL